MQRNIELLNRVMDHIDAHPEQHDQTTWGTCFAGLTVWLGDEPSWFDAVLNTLTSILHFGGNDIPERAIKLLEISREDAAYVFNAGRTREELRAVVDEWTTEAADDLEAELLALVSDSLVLS